MTTALTLAHSMASSAWSLAPVDARVRVEFSLPPRPTRRLRPPFPVVVVAVVARVVVVVVVKVVKVIILRAPAVTLCGTSSVTLSVTQSL